MMVWLYSLTSVVIVSLISLIGIFTLSLKRERLHRITLLLVSFAVGGLFGDAFIHILPEAFEKINTKLVASLLIVAGILLFFSLEKFLRWRHCHSGPCEAHLKTVVTLNLVGDAVHNFLDGVIIAASFLINPTIGITTTVAVVLHEIPQEIGDFGILVHGGVSVRRAMLFNFLCALTSVAGAIVTLIIGVYIKDYTVYILPVIAGGFLYIAGSDLIPELQHEVKLSTSLWQFSLIILGVGMMALLVLLD